MVLFLQRLRGVILGRNLNMNTIKISSSEAGPDRKPDPVFQPEPQVPFPVALDLIASSVRLLFVHGQTTEKVVQAVERLASVLGFRATFFPSWGKLELHLADATGEQRETIVAEPTAMDMSKVSAVMAVVEQAGKEQRFIAAARAELESIARMPPVSATRFALLAAAGAAALGVIFGVTHVLSLILITFSAGAGACLRRWLASVSRNLFVQPFCAAFLAGIVGAVAVHLQLSSMLRLIAVCPCMVLVPGPHILNGAIDLARARIPLGVARLVYASLITLAICTGLILGLALGGVSLPASDPSQAVPLGYDVLAAGVIVAAYGTFFNMPWKMLPIPIAVGMLAHAGHWAAIALMGANLAVGAFVACLVVGMIMTPIADKLHLPFAGIAFASVVSLIPGVFLFRMASGMVELVTLGSQASLETVSQVMTDGITAVLIVIAMTFGLIAPKFCIECFCPKKL